MGVPGIPVVNKNTATAADQISLPFNPVTLNNADPPQFITVPSAINPGTFTAYVEENDPASPRESLVPGVSKVVRKLVTASPSRYQAYCDFLGFPQQVINLAGGPNYLSRAVPAQYFGFPGCGEFANGVEATPYLAPQVGYNLYPLMYAQSIPDVEQVQPNNTTLMLLAGQLPDPAVARYTFARMAVEFQRRTFEILPDSLVEGVSQSAIFALNIGGATGGSFTVGYLGQTVQHTPSVSAAALQFSLQSLSSIGAGNVTVTLAGGIYTITFAGALANTSIVMTGLVGSLTGATNPSFTLVQSGSDFDGLPDESQLLRYVTRNFLPSARALSLPAAFCRWVPQGSGEFSGGLSSGPAAPINEGVVIPIPEGLLTITWHEVPPEAIPYAAIQACIGCINQAPFDPNGINAPIGTVMMEQPDIPPPTDHPIAGRVVNITYKFKIRYNIDSTGVARGWNYGLRAWTDGAGNPHFDYRARASYNRIGLIQGPFVLRNADFNLLFRPA